MMRMTFQILIYNYNSFDSNSVIPFTDIAMLHLFFPIIISNRNFGGVDEMLIQIFPTSMINSLINSMINSLKTG